MLIALREAQRESILIAGQKGAFLNGNCWVFFLFLINY